MWLRNSFWFFAFYSPLTAIVKYLCCYKEKSVFHYIFFIPLCCWKATSVGHFMLAIFWQKPKCKHISVVYSVVIYIGYTPLSRIIISLLIEIWRRKQTLSKWFEWTWRDQRTFYSATSILKKCRKVVLEKWFFKLGFFFLVNHFSRTRKNVDLWCKTIFFSGQPLFLN